MWEISISNQITTFLLSTAVGFCFCLFYDIGRIVRTRYRPGTICVFFIDILFFGVIGIFEFCFFLATCSGEIRGFVFLGNILGFVFCRATFSKIFIFICHFILGFLRKVFLFFERIIFKPILKKGKKAELIMKKTLKKSFFRKKVLKNH